MISCDANKEFSRTFKNTHTERSTITELEAREGILRDFAGKWNERSPLVLYQNDYSPQPNGAGAGH